MKSQKKASINLPTISGSILLFVMGKFLVEWVKENTWEITHKGVLVDTVSVSGFSDERVIKSIIKDHIQANQKYYGA